MEENTNNASTSNRLMPKEVPNSLYRNTSTISCDMLKANKISENGHDNYKRKEMILKVLQTDR